jgi:hypothetical protein
MNGEYVAYTITDSARSCRPKVKGLLWYFSANEKRLWPSEYGDETQSPSRCRITTKNAVENTQSWSVNNDMAWQKTFPPPFKTCLTLNDPVDKYE